MLAVADHGADGPAENNVSGGIRSEHLCAGNGREAKGDGHDCKATNEVHNGSIPRTTTEWQPKTRPVGPSQKSASASRIALRS
jgi:hypothetical protein